MPDETKFGSPIPPGENEPGTGAPLACAEFEALLTDALEGLLTETSKQSFDAHRRACAVCGPLFADVEAGRLWLRQLEPVEPPQFLVHNILVATTGVVSTRVTPAAAGARTTPFAERVREWWDSWFSPVGAFVRQPRFMMSFGMIFFTFSLILSAAGIKASDVARINLRPSALRHTYNDAQIRFVQYYDNIRFVYEIESKVRELKRATTPAEPAPKEKKDTRNPNDNTSGQPEQKQDRNYSREGNQLVLASLPGLPDNVPHQLLRQATSYEPRAASESLLASSKIIAHSCSPLEARHTQPPVTLTTTLTTNRRFV